MGLPNPSREAKFSGANGDRAIFIFVVQLTTSRIGNLTLLIVALAICNGHNSGDEFSVGGDCEVCAVDADDFCMQFGFQNVLNSLV